VTIAVACILAATLGLPVLHRDGEVEAVTAAAEALRHRDPVQLAETTLALQRGSVSDRLDAILAVDQRNPDLVIACPAIGLDVPVAAAGGFRVASVCRIGCVQRSDQVGQRAV